jgi:hypothetical protein
MTLKHLGNLYLCMSCFFQGVNLELFLLGEIWVVHIFSFAHQVKKTRELPHPALLAYIYQNYTSF